MLYLESSYSVVVKLCMIVTSMDKHAFKGLVIFF